MAIVNAGQLAVYEEIEPDLRERVEDVLLNRREDANERLVDFAMHPIRDRSGSVRFLHPTGIDITERKRAEEQTRVLMAEVNHRARTGRHS